MTELTIGQTVRYTDNTSVCNGHIVPEVATGILKRIHTTEDEFFTRTSYTIYSNKLQREIRISGDRMVPEAAS